MQNTTTQWSNTGVQVTGILSNADNTGEITRQKKRNKKSVLSVFAPILSALIILAPILPAQNITPILSSFRYFKTLIIAALNF